MDPEGEHRGLLAAATFREQPRLRATAPSAQELLTKVWGTKNAPTQRVSESLDYEPVQNAIFYKRMRAAKEKKNLFGCAPRCAAPLRGVVCPHGRRTASRPRRAARAYGRPPPRCRPLRCSRTCMPARMALRATRGEGHAPRDASPARPAQTHSYTGHTFAKFIITIATGLLTGVFAVGLSKIVGAAFDWKNEYIQSVLDGPGTGRIWIAFLWHCAYSCCLVSFAVALVRGALFGERGLRRAGCAVAAGAAPARGGGGGSDASSISPRVAVTSAAAWDTALTDAGAPTPRSAPPTLRCNTGRPRAPARA
jgi:hypothetical protein